MRLLNFKELTNHGHIQGRQDTLAMLDAGVTACDPYYNTLDLIRLDGYELSIGHPDFEATGDPDSGIDKYDIRAFEHIYVVGAGKGVYRVVQALEHILGQWLTDGEIICKHGDSADMKTVHVTFGNHPTPDAGCVEGCLRIVSLAEKVTEKDLVFTVIANGGSSLLTLPIDGVSLQDVIDITRICQIECGMPTEHLNIIRNHIDKLKGGKLARMFSKAKQVSIAVEDINHQDMGPVQDFDYLMHHGIWLHNMPEGSSFSDALKVLEDYGVKEKCPKSILGALECGTSENETVKYAEYRNYDARVFGVMPQCRSFTSAIEEKAHELGYSSAVLAKHMNPHASDMGEILSALGNCVEQGDSIFSAPVVLIMQGEMLVATGTVHGVGGRNQECALTVSKLIRGSSSIVCACVDTDGTDGPGGIDEAGNWFCFSGGIVDGTSYNYAENVGVDVEKALIEHASSNALKRMNDAIIISPGISIGDILLLVVTQ